MDIKQGNLLRQFEMFKDEYENKALEVLRSGWYILGKEVKAFEEEFAAYLGAKYCAGLASGLDALYLSFRVLNIGEGDEVIVPANTYIASVMGITMAGATPVFVEPDEFYNINPDKIEEKINEKTKAVLSVNLYGQACDLEKISGVCKKYNLYLVEDCAQSHGARFNGVLTNKYCDISCYSFYPSKNLGCFGDGGAIVTDNEDLYKLFKIYRNYGSEVRYHNMVVGVNSRLDELQAGLLRVKLMHLDELNEERAQIAQKYNNGIKNSKLELPTIREGATTVWHQFVVRTKDRDELVSYLAGKGIGTLIHYPIPPHLSEAYAYLGYKEGDFEITERCAKEILSLPIYNGMTDEEINYVIDALNAF
ncbi:MAG: DegT/DnrJ/EryC1/StrS family aminotransferase [Clostridia bacterium]|nr:DegT/DnrJ/EryC1/StrS family aminotransferase [Clostridia bacterium]